MVDLRARVYATKVEETAKQVSEMVKTKEFL